eukprot:s2320_g5.t1
MYEAFPPVNIITARAFFKAEHKAMSEGRKAALERLRAAREGNVSCAEQYVVPEAKKILQQVSEEEFRSIVAERRSDWVVGKKDGYSDGGQELWQGKDVVRQRVLEDERDRKLLAQMDPDGRKTRAVKDQTETAPAGRGAFLGALQKGAALSSAGVPNSSTKKDQNKLLDDMLEQMCGELEAEPKSGTPEVSMQQVANETIAPPPSMQDHVPTIDVKATQDESMEPKEPIEVAEPEPKEPKLKKPKLEQLESLEACKVHAVASPPAEELQPAAVPEAPIQALPDLLPNLPSEDLIANGAQQVSLDEHGGLWFFFIDAFEDDRSSPPRVYLFGKVQTVTGGFCSCCLVVENLERCIHLLLKVDPEAATEEVEKAAVAAEKEFDSICQRQCPNIRKLRSKLKWRNYAFEKSLPHGLGHLPFLKIVCDASGGLPREIYGQTFSHAFGVQTSLLERILLTKQIMGPGWLRLKPGSFKNEAARLSYCAQEFRMTPNSFHWPRTEEDKTELAKSSPAVSPPLRMMSLSMQTVQQSSQAPHEVLAIACTLHTNVSADAGSEDPRMGTWAAVRRLDINPLPRDADKALAQAGMQTCNNELHLLTSFLAKVQEFDPDVLAGHNAYACDLDILASRFQQLKMSTQWQKLGRLRRPKDRVPRSEGRQGQGFWVGSNLLAGRLVCDVLLQAKDLLPKMGCYDLPNLAKEQLRISLQNVEPESIASSYSSARSLKDFVDLKLRHAHCIAQLVQMLQILPLTRQLTNLAGNLWNASLQNKRAERNELLLCHEFHKKKFVLPDKENAKKKKMLTDMSCMGLEEPDDDAQAAGAPRRKAAAYSGGLVLAPKLGSATHKKHKRNHCSEAMLWGNVDGKDVHLVTLKTEKLEADICSLGAALVAVRVKVRGEWIDVVLGYESLERDLPCNKIRYTNGGKPNFGTVVGRCANRIANATFELDGEEHKLDINNGNHHLHGGTKGFYSQVFDVADVSEKQVTLTLSEPDGAMGYPGKVDASVTYEVNDGELHFRYAAATDKPTLVSMTNHAYWNLKGHQAGDVLDHVLMVAASRTTATDETLAITGELPEVSGGLDLTLGGIAVDEGGPIDRNYCLDRPGGAGDFLAARLVGPNKVTMEVWTDQPGLQVFTGSNIGTTGPGTWWHGKGCEWKQFGAICLEPQLWPDGVHHPEFQSPILRPGETYQHHSWHVFRVED